MGGVRARNATRLAWSMWVACVVLATLALALDFAAPESIQIHFRPGERPGPVLAVLMGLLSLAYPTVGALIASRLPTNPIGWIFCGAGLLYEVQRFAIVYADYALLTPFTLPWGEYVAWFSTWVGLAAPVLAGVFLMLLFPDGRLPSRRWRPVAWVAVFGAALTALGSAFTLGRLRTHFFVENPFRVVGVIGDTFLAYQVFSASIVLGTTLLSISTLAALFSLILRLHRARGDERQQLKWFLYAAVPATVCVSVALIEVVLYHSYTSFYFFENLPDYTGLWNWELLVLVSYLGVCAALAVPVFTYIAILRYHLFDIDLFINRTLVYGALSACVVGVYVLAVVGLGALFQAQGAFGISLLATGLVAVLFAPLRDRLQRGVNRLMHGERDDPYAVVSRLGERLEATPTPNAVLPTITETVREALKLPYAAITLMENGAAPSVAASAGKPVAKPMHLPLTYQSEPVGELLLGPRGPGDTFGPADRRLLEGLARQAGVAAYAVRLTADLQRSRERLVAAREEERRRLRRNLHDGLGAQLAGLNVQTGTLQRLIRHDPAAADELVVELREELRAAIADIRRLVYDLRPPALDDLGLVAALHQLAQRYGAEGEQLRVSVEATEDLAHLPAAVEVAAYRIVQEALTNVVRHARAKSCLVRLAVEEEVTLEILDDGVGISDERTAGVGLSSMRERASELGGSYVVENIPKGGTQVLVRLPLPREE